MNTPNNAAWEALKAEPELLDMTNPEPEPEPATANVDSPLWEFGHCLTCGRPVDSNGYVSVGDKCIPVYPWECAACEGRQE